MGETSWSALERPPRVVESFDIAIIKIYVGTCLYSSLKDIDAFRRFAGFSTREAMSFCTCQHLVNTHIATCIGQPKHAVLGQQGHNRIQEWFNNFLDINHITCQE
jgi:hypothetical protein